MVAEGAFADNFTSAGNLDTLGGTLVGFKFWHFITFPTLVNIRNALGCREPVGVFTDGLLVADHEGKVAAAHLRLAIDDDLVAELLNDAIHQLCADFFVSHFAATENDHDFDAIAVFE